MENVVDIAIMGVLFFLTAYFAYLAIKVWRIPDERYDEHRQGISGAKGAIWGDNEIHDEGRCEGLVATNDGKIKLKQSYSQSATERLFR